MYIRLRTHKRQTIPYSKVNGANIGLIWGRQDPDGPHVGPINFAIWDHHQAKYEVFVKPILKYIDRDLMEFSRIQYSNYMKWTLNLYSVFENGYLRYVQDKAGSR